MERVWDYPRPPAVVPCERRVRVELAGEVLADSIRALRVLETSHPPTIYIPPTDVHEELPGRKSRSLDVVRIQGRGALLGRGHRRPAIQGSRLGPTRIPRPGTRRCVITSPSTPDAWTLPG